MTVIDAKHLEFKELNRQIRAAVARGEKKLRLENVNGQRYIGCGLRAETRIEVCGVPGADMAAFMDGPEIVVRANADCVIGNTMNAGKVVVHGSVGDVLGYSMRGGKIFVRGDAGYRAGIHMKSFRDKVPVIVVGGRAQDFLGEYMAGGTLVVLGLGVGEGERIVGRFVGTGLHGGAIFLRGRVDDHQLGAEVSPQNLTTQDERMLARILREYCAEFGLEYESAMNTGFVKLAAHSHRPYAKLYAY